MGIPSWKGEKLQFEADGSEAPVTAWACDNHLRVRADL